MNRRACVIFAAGLLAGAFAARSQSAGAQHPLDALQAPGSIPAEDLRVLNGTESRNQYREMLPLYFLRISMR